MGGLQRTDAEVRRRGVLVTATSVALILISIPLVLRLAWAQADTAPTIQILLVGCALMALNPVILKIGLSARAVGVLLCLEVLVALALLSHENGGLDAASLLWSLTVPFLGVWLVSPAFGLVCAALVAAETITFYVATVAGYSFPRPLTDVEMRWWDMAGMVSVVSFLAFVAWLFETQRKRATERILRYQSQLDAALAHVPMVLFRADRDARIQWMEGRAEAVTGQPASAFIDRSLPELGSELEKLAEPIERALKEPTAAVIAVGARTLDVRCTPVADSDGEVRGVAGLAIDVSESVGKAQRLLLLERAIETTTTGITIKDPDGRIVYVNAAEVAMHGYEFPEELLGSRASVFGLPDATRKQSITDLNAMGSWSRESVNVRKDGTAFPVQLISDVVRDERRVPLGVVTTCEDITERERAATELKEAHEKLRATSSQLIHNEKLTALGELAASVAHDLNQPLNTIKIISQSMLRDSAKSRYDLDDLPDDAREIVEVVNKMATVVDHLRLYARRPIVKPQEMVDLNACITSVVAMLEEQLTAQGVDLRIALEPDLPAASGEPRALEQVFMNLLTNARDALQSRRENEPTIAAEITIRSLHDDTDGLVVEIRDNAGGIPEEIREKIFDPFFTTKDAGDGTGLGLAIVHRIVSAHGGRIDVDIEPGEGTTFRVIFPASSD